MSNRYLKNRENFAAKMENESVLVVFAGEAPLQGGDSLYPYCPNRNFFYLTGIKRERHILVIVKNDEGKAESTLFIERFDEHKAKWVGAVLVEEQAKEISAVEKFKFLDEFYEYIQGPLLRRKYKKVYLDFSKFFWNQPDSPAERFAKELFGKRPTVEFIDAAEIFGDLRNIKSEEEVADIQRACDITADGLRGMMINFKPGVREFELEAHYNHVLKQNGADFGFNTIAAGGKNATVLHYVDNDSAINDGELVLFDLGAAWNLYSADISRTYPINGKFSERQKQLYEIVLEANRRVIAEAKPGLETKRLNEIVIEFYQEKLFEIGLIKEKTKEEVAKYYYHGVGHGLGLETHDAGKPKELVAGMVLTVEPGLYVAEEGIGIRIEDDIVITEDGCKVLTTAAPKTVDEIENFFASLKK